MASSDELFPGARVSTTRIAPRVRGMRAQLGTVIGREAPMRVGATGPDEAGTTEAAIAAGGAGAGVAAELLRVTCKCCCGGYWRVRWDDLKAPNNVLAFLAHDLNVLEVVDQLAYRAEEAPTDG